MTAYGAVISLKNTIHYILDSSNFSLVEPSQEILQLTYKELQPLREILERLDSTSTSRSRKKVNALDERIKEAVWKFEDLLESLLSHQIIGDERDVLLFSIDLQCLQDDVGSFTHTLKNLEEEYIFELENMGEDEECISSSIGFGGTNSKMVGLSDQFEHVKSAVMQDCYKYGGKYVYVLSGMAGVGKTTLAKEIFQHPEIMRVFEHRAWVTVGRKPHLNQLRSGILTQLCGDEEIGDYLKEILESKKCLIVLDDVWETEVFNSLLSFLPDIENVFIPILVTARAQNVIYSRLCSVNLVRFLNGEESKDLLCEKVFGDEICPPQLDKAATKIAKNCEGLPLLIVTVADILSKSQNRDPDYWNDVAEERNSVFTDAHNQISKVLFPSYDYLPQYLKMPFLHMGVFPPDYDTPQSKIINMLAAEGWFFDTNQTQSVEESVCRSLEELCTNRNLVLFNNNSNYWIGTSQSGKFKNCWLHSSWRHLCRGEAMKNKFYHVLKRLIDSSEEDVKGQRCLCLQNNILFGFEEFCNSVRCNCASSTRSLLFFGPYHQYPIPIHVSFKLLRELDALNLRFYIFPNEILTLVQLKYLALTCNAELPTTISKLFNLRVLIIHPHIKIRCCRVPPYIPIQIWDMQELEHIEILGRSLVAPYHIASLEKLTTLVGVNASICTISELSRRIPNIRKLGVEIELTPYDDHNDLLSCFACISTLESLKTLKCSIINPVIIKSFPAALASSLMLPLGLEKLHLSGTGFPWEYMDVIGSLPYLKVLKLRSYAFQGSKWEARERSFWRLEFLLIEDSDLVCLNLSSVESYWFSYLSMKHCYKLKEINWPQSYSIIRKIEIVDCNASVLSWAKQLHDLSSHTRFDVIASSSFEEKPITIKLQRFWDS